MQMASAAPEAHEPIDSSNGRRLKFIFQIIVLLPTLHFFAVPERPQSAARTLFGASPKPAGDLGVGILDYFVPLHERQLSAR